MQPDEGVEDQEFRLQPHDSFLQRLLVLQAIEAQRRHGDDLDIETLKVDAGGRGDAFEALAHDVGRVLGGKKEHGAGLVGREAAQARRARGDGDGEIEGEEGLAALRLATDDPDGLSAP